MTTETYLAIAAGMILAAVTRFLRIRGAGWGAISPYKKARVEGRSVTLPGRRGVAVVGSALGAAAGILLGVQPWLHPETSVIVDTGLVALGGMLLVLSLAGTAAVARPDMLRFDDEHLEITSWSTAVKVPWDEVLRVGPAPYQIEVFCRGSLTEEHVERRPRLGITSRVQDDRILVSPHTVHRPWIVLRLLHSLASLDRQGRAEMIDEVVLPALTTKAMTLEGLTQRYVELARMDDRTRALAARRHSQW